MMLLASCRGRQEAKYTGTHDFLYGTERCHTAASLDRDGAHVVRKDDDDVAAVQSCSRRRLHSTGTFLS